MTPAPAVRRMAAPTGVAGLAISLLLAGCGTSPASDTTTEGATMTQTPADELGAGAVLRPQDDGATVRLVVGEEVSLQLAPPWDEAEPVSEDADVVEVVRVDHLTDPGYAEFSLLALGPGAVRVQVEGDGEQIAFYLTVTD